MFTATSQHALRALAHLSQVPAGDFILGRQLAEAAGVPANFLSKIMLTLRKAGLVEATRGHGGGYRLVKPARDITLLQVVELFEGANAQPRCVLGEKHLCNNEEGWRRAYWLASGERSPISDFCAATRSRTSDCTKRIHHRPGNTFRR